MKPAPKKVVEKKLRVPVFKYSTRNKSKAAYLDRATTFKKKYGVVFSFPLRGKITSQAKSAITRKTRRLTGYLLPKNRFVFVPVSTKGLRTVKRKRQAEAQAFTPKGVFIQRPKTRGKTKPTKIRITSEGIIYKQTGKRRSEHVIYKSADVVADPSMIVREALKRGKQTQILVNIKGYSGNEAHNVHAWLWYFENDLIEDIEQQIAEEEGAFQKHFGVEFVNFGKPVARKPDTKSSNAKSKNSTSGKGGKSRK